MEELKAENLQVSEKILWLNAQTNQMKLHLTESQEQHKTELQTLNNSLKEAHQLQEKLRNEIQQLQMLIDQHTEQQR